MTVPSSPLRFYDDLAAEYHLLFDAWWEGAVWHGEVIGAELRRVGAVPPARLLDATCGIGTQAIPLAQQGFRVTGTDLSALAIERAAHEASTRGIEATFAVADIRLVRASVEGSFEAVISCDNALAHLPELEDLTTAFGSVRACLGDGGVFLASIRDYDALAEEPSAGVVPVCYGPPGRRHIVGQSWTWSADTSTVDIQLLILREAGENWSATVRETTMRAWRRTELEAALGSAGFGRLEWREPEATGYLQPILVAVAGRAA
ncbi:MAG: class I SAM-dependent DNA methyltransferase [Planctomycetaceae bacterium]